MEGSSALRHDVEWSLLGTVAGAAVVLAFVGYRDAYPAYSWTDSLFAAFQLFVLEGGVVEQGTPWPLEVARLLAPAVLAYAGIRAALLLARERALRLHARLLVRGHVIVVGLTDSGFSAATQLSASGRDVVVVDGSPASPRAAACTQRGIAVVFGDPTDGAVLARARPDRAADILITTGSDSASLQALAACELASASARRPPALHVEIESATLWQTLHSVGFARVARPPVEFFSRADREARNLLDAAATRLEGPGEAPGIVIHGDGAVVTRLLTHAVWRSPSAGDAPVVLLRGTDARGQLARAVAEAPWLTEAAECVAMMPGAVLPAKTRWAFVCGLADAEALAVAVELSGELSAPGGAVWTSVSDAVLARVLGPTRLLPEAVCFVAAPLAAYGSSLLRESAIELVARAKHENYVAQEARRNPGALDNHSLVAWAELPDSLKRSNIRFAESVAAKLAALDATLAPLTDARSPAALSLAPTQLDELARAEHERWMRDLEDDGWGWTKGAKDPKEKLHPLLVPWEQLGKDEQEKDRDAVRELPRLLARAGYRIVMPAATEAAADQEPG